MEMDDHIKGMTEGSSQNSQQAIEDKQSEIKEADDEAVNIDADDNLEVKILDYK